MVENCLKVEEREEVLLVLDQSQRNDVERALIEAVTQAGGGALSIRLPPTESGPPGPEVQEPPRVVAEAMKSADAIIAHTTMPLARTAARKEAQSTGARIIVIRTFNQAFTRTLNIDFDAVSQLTRRVADAMSTSKEALITTPHGTNLRIGMGNKTKAYSGLCKNKRDYEQIPFGVTAVAPKEGSAEGKLVVDKSGEGIGRVSEPIVIDIKENRIVSIEGGREADILRSMLEKTEDTNAFYTPAEWGVGTNPQARFLGRYPTMEDERVQGAAHIGIGGNLQWDGGTIKSNFHIDVNISDVDILLDGKPILKNRRFLL